MCNAAGHLNVIGQGSLGPGYTLVQGSGRRRLAEGIPGNHPLSYDIVLLPLKKIYSQLH